LPDLATLQSDFFRAILGSDGDAVLPVIDGDPVAAARRLAVYRNTALSGLYDALRSIYPITERVLGSEFFEQTSLAFARENPPTAPVLARYGAGFPSFLRGLPALTELPYIADLATLEWEIDQAALAPSQGSQQFTLPVAGGAARMTLDPSLRLFASTTRVHAIWSAIRSGDDHSLSSLDWRGGDEHLAIFFTIGEAVVTPLSRPAWIVLSGLVDGKDLATAVAALDAAEIDEAALAHEILSARFIRIELDH